MKKNAIHPRPKGQGILAERMKYLLIILLSFIICIFAEKIANNAYKNREIVFSGIVSPKYNAPYRCIFPWHIGRKLKGFDIEGHDSFVCEWELFWVDWNVDEKAP